MHRRLSACLTVLLAACGDVGSLPPDAAPAAPPDGPSIDASSQPEGCNGIDDDGDGEVDEVWADRYVVTDFTDRLGDWSRKVGAVAAGQPKVVAGALYLDDAGIALSEDTPSVSWIYDLDADEGTQVTHDAPIGVGDFELIADLELRSSEAQLTLAGIALTGAGDRIALFMGGYDPSARPMTLGALVPGCASTGRIATIRGATSPPGHRCGQRSARCAAAAP